MTNLGAGGGVPGVVGTGSRVGGWEGYTGYPPRTIPGTLIKLIPETGPTHGQMKLISVFYEVSQTGSQIGSRIDLRLTSESTSRTPP